MCVHDAGGNRGRLDSYDFHSTGHVTFMMPLESIRIGPFDVRILVMDADAASANEFKGEFDSNSLKIFLSSRLTGTQLADAWLHEVLHVINYIWNNKDGTTEEDYTSRIAVAMTCLWLDNPEWFAWYHALFYQDL